jgi:fructosamine-3-kinase
LIKENLNTIKKIKYKLLQYKKNNKGIRSIIHGDLVFSNVFYDLKKELKLIDPRGGQQNKFTTVGDLFYDFAKIYQSLTGYEHILSGKKNYKEKYYQNLKIKFETFFKLKFGNDQFEYLKYLTVSLYISLIPLHDKTNWRKFFQKAKQLLV